MKDQDVDKSQGHHPVAKSMQWKSALSGTVEGDFFALNQDLILT